MRSLYTGMIHPIFTWGAKVWPHKTHNINAFNR